MGLNYFMIDEMGSLDFGIIISDAAVFDAPARAYESVNVPGRNGAVLFDEGYYENVTVSYEAQMLNNGANLDGFRSWFASHRGYCRLEDTYHPEEFRLGIPQRLSVSTERKNRIGKFKVEFNCKPQRFLKSGEIGTTYTEDFTVFNPTHFPAKPLMRVTGHGIIGIGDSTVTIASHSLDYIDLDFDTADARCGSTNANQYVTLSGDDYPSLSAGATGITLGTGISSIVLYPRWWSL